VFSVSKEEMRAVKLSGRELTPSRPRTENDMKKVAALLIIFGSGLAAFGLAGWKAVGTPATRWVEDAPRVAWDFSAGWSLGSELEMAAGVMLLVWGVILRKDSKQPPV
jgi:hypothetical protein